MPPWMIEGVEKARRERAERERPRARIEVPKPASEPKLPEQQREPSVERGVIRIEVAPCC